MKLFKINHIKNGKGTGNIAWSEVNNMASNAHSWIIKYVKPRQLECKHFEPMTHKSKFEKRYWNKHHLLQTTTLKRLRDPAAK